MYTQLFLKPRAEFLITLLCQPLGLDQQEFYDPFYLEKHLSHLNFCYSVAQSRISSTHFVSNHEEIRSFELLGYFPMENPLKMCNIRPQTIRLLPDTWNIVVMATMMAYFMCQLDWA